jgi:hypothetical protein
VRVAFVLLLVVVLPGMHVASVLVPAVAAVFVVAAVYEAVRSKAAGCTSVERPCGAAVALWFVSGAGYCVRGLTGFALAAGSHATAAALVLAGATSWFAGIVFVTTRWAVETVPFASRESGRLVWRATSGQGRGHLLPLTRWIAQPAGLPADLRSWRPLWMTRSPSDAPWNVALAAALGLSAATGAALAAPSFAPMPTTGCFALAAGAWFLLVFRPSRSVGAVVIVATALAGVVIGDLAYSVPSVVCALYVMCMHQCLDEIGMSMPARLRLRLAAPLAAVRAGGRPSPRVPVASRRLPMTERAG